MSTSKKVDPVRPVDLVDCGEYNYKGSIIFVGNIRYQLYLISYVEQENYFDDCIGITSRTKLVIEFISQKFWFS